MWIDRQVMETCDQDMTIKVFVPSTTVVVLGQNNKAQTEVHEQNCAKDGVEVLRRKGGGGTVVLHDGCVVVSVGGWVKDYYDNSKYFQLLNQSIIDALAAKVPLLGGLSQNGISDIVWQDKKIAGTSLFRSRNYFLYQASVLIDPRLPLIEAYLQHPTKEPDYRGQRSHRQFVTGIQHIDPSLKGISALQWSDELNTHLAHALEQQLSERRIPAVSEQLSYLRKKAAAL